MIWFFSTEGLKNEIPPAGGGCFPLEEDLSCRFGGLQVRLLLEGKMEDLICLCTTSNVDHGRWDERDLPLPPPRSF